MHESHIPAAAIMTRRGRVRVISDVFGFEFGFEFGVGFGFVLGLGLGFGLGPVS